MPSPLPPAAIPMWPAQYSSLPFPHLLVLRQIGDSTDIIPATGKDTTANQLTQSSSAQGKRGAAHSKNVQDFLSASELFNLYNMLNALKKTCSGPPTRRTTSSTNSRVSSSPMPAPIPLRMAIPARARLSQAQAQTQPQPQALRAAKRSRAMCAAPPPPR